MTKREWRDIAGFEGRYQVSDDGRVRSLVTEIEMRQQTHTAGYLTVALTLRDGSGNKRHFLAHRLVAEAFIPRGGDNLVVNHKDGDKTNNRRSNLEWLTHGDNHRHAYRELGRKPHLATLLNSSRACICYRNGVEIGRYPSAQAGADAQRLKQRSVSRACRGERKTCGGMEWRYI